MPTIPTSPIVDGRSAPAGVPPFQQGVQTPPDLSAIREAQGQIARALSPSGPGRSRENPFAGLARDELLTMMDDLALQRRELERRSRMIPPSFRQLETLSPMREAPVRTENPFLRFLLDFLTRKGT